MRIVWLERFMYENFPYLKKHLWKSVKRIEKLISVHYAALCIYEFKLAKYLVECF